jgi:hypothetical protein
MERLLAMYPTSATRDAHVWVTDSHCSIQLSMPGAPPLKMLRAPDEPLSACLRRLVLSVQKASRGKKESAPAAETARVFVTLPGGQNASDDTPNRDAWVDGARLCWEPAAAASSAEPVAAASSDAAAAAETTTWRIVRDAPVVAVLSPPELPLVGFPALAHAIATEQSIAHHSRA